MHRISFDMWFMSSQRSYMPEKEKSYWSVSEMTLPPLLTDRQTEEDNSALEKLRCHSAGGAKTYFIMSKMHNFWNKATRGKCGVNVV